jgi:hypothetical protein
MAKQRGYPDQRGLWAESDSIAEQFVPNERYKAQQRAMAQTLLAAGLNPEQIAAMLFVPEDLSSGDEAKDETAASDSSQRIRNRVFRSTRALPKTTLRFLAQSRGLPLAFPVPVTASAKRSR